MPSLRSAFELVAGRLLAPAGYDLRLKILDERPEGFPGYLEAAERAGQDVNEWEEAQLGWKSADEILGLTTYDHLRDGSVVCEIGPGTGRFSRLMLRRMGSAGRLHLVDHSPWMVRFLRRYFAGEARVAVHLSDGHSLPAEVPTGCDVVFAAGTLVALKLGEIHLYAREFARVLRPGGLAIFDYIDPTTEEGWAHMQREAPRLGYVYTYHAGQVLDRVFREAGFEVVERRQVEKSTYLTLRRVSAT